MSGGFDLSALLGGGALFSNTNSSASSSSVGVAVNPNIQISNNGGPLPSVSTGGNANVSGGGAYAYLPAAQSYGLPTPGVNSFDDIDAIGKPSQGTGATGGGIMDMLTDPLVLAALGVGGFLFFKGG